LSFSQAREDKIREWQERQDVSQANGAQNTSAEAEDDIYAIEKEVCIHVNLFSDLTSGSVLT
jgi:hypothetical protein